MDQSHLVADDDGHDTMSTHAPSASAPHHPPPLTRHSSVPPSLFGSGRDSLSRSAMATTPPPTIGTTHPNHDAVNGAQPPLSTLAGPSSVRDSRLEDEVRSAVERRMIARVEKDADDPTTPPSAATRDSMDRHQATTLTTLSRLFAVQAPTSPDQSRSQSYLYPHRHPAGYTRNLMTTDVGDLPHHLYTRGLLEGRHSDITVNAFGHQYKLHRLILDRAPFFTSALSPPWSESNSREITVHPEDIDTSITQHAFELALKRLYGCGDVKEEDTNAAGLFATGSWLEMQDLIDSSVSSMLRQMRPETLSSLIRLVTTNYYGRAGDKVLASAKAMLCREGWRMPIKYWDGIPGDIIREIVGGDGFFIDGEWDRWVLAKRILDRRLRVRALEAGLVDGGKKVRKAPDAVSLMAVRFDGVYRRSSTSRGMPDALATYVSLYTHPEVEPVLVLLDEGIHYIHLDFEQLQYIRRARDCLGLPIMPEKVISAALWQQMELRQKILNARDSEMELGVSIKCTDDSATLGAGRDTTMSITTPSTPPEQNKGKHRAIETDEDVEDIDSGSWDGNGRPRKFWIPASDCNIVMGGNADPVIATSNNTTLQRHANRLSATLQPEDVQWAADFTAITSQPRPPTLHGQDGEGRLEPPAEVSYTHFPPFRFAAEFPNPRLLKEKKRFYSRTVFYAGSLWNIYIQKIATSRNKQLGVYLHRAKERETEEVVNGTAGLAQGSVDERIGQLEREMIMRSERRERRHRRREEVGLGVDVNDAGAESSGSVGDHDTSVRTGGDGRTLGSSAPTRSSTMRSLLSSRSSRGSRRTAAADPDLGRHTSSAANATSSTSFSLGLDLPIPPPVSEDEDHPFLPEQPDDEDEDDASDDSDILSETLDLQRRRRSGSHHLPTLPPYVDGRPTIKTYFKIYSPSRGGRMLSVYESAPDKFNFSQSWGWKSSTLMLDEGILGDDDAPMGAGGGEGGAVKGDGKLRFMVVIGNI
ncbi:germ cell-less [Teratosphaeria destructans]|uniref:Germ cell-less n=1 Tax=Teratosphaeria destructans TaxID=418781 RepID=A0A9W7SWN7_9PEZI|nr:germ cell-less [Teratosphaeria destructans]